MQHIHRTIKLNDQYKNAEVYSNRLESISRITNWHEQKLKFDKRIEHKTIQKNIDKELQGAAIELKKRRNFRLKELYDIEAKKYEQELADKGLAIYKIKI